MTYFFVDTLEGRRYRLPDGHHVTGVGVHTEGHEARLCTTTYMRRARIILAGPERFVLKPCSTNWIEVESGEPAHDRDPEPLDVANLEAENARLRAELARIAKAPTKKARHEAADGIAEGWAS